ncbi:PIH1 domain-containing protein 1-like [Uranotaenia lowii]|uniref:PIH1 domain-containing protein 1-like n=1 Tax=Uranotaenia lowii TaxID=190385 RepID=UPI00247A7FF6|nr:PIH1 domain-containing protein 1-like [Uranotaenia lowii]
MDFLQNHTIPAGHVIYKLTFFLDCIFCSLAGFCVKAFVKETREKFFINLCQTEAIPAPEDVTDDQLMELLNDGSAGSFKIPMSITQPRTGQDHSGKPCQLCDIAVNSNFFKKIEKGGLIRDFLITIIFEGIDAKFNLTLDETDWRLLKNKTFMDKLITHNIQNRDVKSVYESYKNPSAEDLQKIQELESPSPLASLNPERPRKKLIEEIDPVTVKTMKDVKNKQEYVPNPTKLAISQAASKKPDYRLLREPARGKAKVLIGEFYLPEVTTINEITLDIGEDRILLEARKKGYLLDAFVDLPINNEKIKAEFNTVTKILNVIMPVVACS